MAIKSNGIAFAAFFGVLLSSCATMSPEECKVADWRDVGQRDGINGKPLTRLYDRAEDCRKVGVTVNLKAYNIGRDQGLRSYCRLDNAVPLGLNGGTYAGVCPTEIDQVFRHRFQTARSVHDLRSEVKGLNERIDTLERRLREASRDEEKRLKEAVSEEQRRKVRKTIDDEQRDIRAELNEADRRLRRKRDELRSAEVALNNLR